MKKQLLALACILAGTTGAAHAVDSTTLRFEGNILGGTCDLATSDVGRTIRLDPVRVPDFASTSRPFTADFNLTAQCDSDVSTVSFIFSGTAVGYGFQNTGTSKNVDLRIYSYIGNVESNIRASESQANRTRTVQTSNGRAVLPMRASYFKGSGTPTKGTFVSAVTVNITYN